MKSKYLSKAVYMRNLVVVVLIGLMLYACGPAPTPTSTANPPTAESTATTASVESTATATVPAPAAATATYPTAVIPVILPTDAKATCTVSSSEFAGWFGGKVTLNGAVQPADSVAFNPDSICSFYKWSEQMFLWLVSPAPSEYGGGQHVFDSPVFYDVSPPDSSGNRVFIPHDGKVISLGLRADQNGPHDLPIITDKTGKSFEVLPIAKEGSEEATVLNAAGQKVEVKEANAGAGAPIFLGADKKPITGVKPIIPDQFKGLPGIIQPFLVDGSLIFLDPDGKIVENIEFEQGQAGGGAVLQAQNKSLVYYSILANDVFAYFLTGAKTGEIAVPNNQFPTTQADLDAVIAFAAKSGKKLPDANALAMEIKMSWVDADTLPDKGKGYITMTAMITDYDQTNPYLWTPKQPLREATLALVGVHVVGSTAGHPELIWATFEHVNNTPLAEYSYINTQGTEITVPENTVGDWVFSASGATDPFNVERMKVNGSNIAALATTTPIGPSNTIRWKAWSAATNANPNPDQTPAESNTDVISLNVNVIGMLFEGDVRANYVLTGATWTDGTAPTGSFSQPTPGATPGNEVGTSLLNNTTMETYKQGKDSTNGNGVINCFACHSGSGGAPNPNTNTNTTFISHIYPNLGALFGATLTPTPTNTPAPTTAATATVAATPTP